MFLFLFAKFSGDIICFKEFLTVSTLLLPFVITTLEFKFHPIKGILFKNIKSWDFLEEF